MSERRLGRGLDALLGEGAEAGVESEAPVQELPLDMIRPGSHQPRKRIDPEALEELAESIRSQGIVQPIVVRSREDRGDYELIAGERRWRAAQLAERATIPAMVRDLTGDEALEIALIENIQREELSPMEEARAFDRLTREFGLTHEALAEQVGRKRATISNALRLLRLPAEVQEALDEGSLRMGHARALLALEGDERLGEIAREVVTKGLSVRATEERVRRALEGQSSQRSQGSPNRKDPDVQRLEEELGERLGARVRITQRKDRGRLEVEYASLEELEGLIDRLRRSF